jgi:hypothetical protein
MFEFCSSAVKVERLPINRLILEYRQIGVSNRVDVLQSAPTSRLRR